MTAQRLELHGRHAGRHNDGRRAHDRVGHLRPLVQGFGEVGAERQAVRVDLTLTGLVLPGEHGAALAHERSVAFMRVIEASTSA